jgi:hypothetical protein
MLLPSVGALEHGMIKQLKASAVEIVVDLGLFSLAPSEKALGDPGLSKAAQLRAIGTKHFWLNEHIMPQSDLGEEDNA